VIVPAIDGNITQLVQARVESERHTRADATLRAAIMDLVKVVPKLKADEIRRHLAEIQAGENDCHHLPPLTDGDTRIAGILVEEPPEPEAILTYHDRSILVRGLVQRSCAWLRAIPPTKPLHDILASHQTI
jgi:hypothetical protein